MSDAITRLQRERDLALRRIDELHAYFKKKIKTKEESHARRDSSINKNYLKVSGDLDQGKLLCDTHNLMMKRLQKELGEEAEFDPDEDPHLRRVRREYEQCIEDNEECIRQLESEQRSRDHHATGVCFSSNLSVNHWTVDWDVATIIEALEELHPLQAEHKYLDDSKPSNLNSN